jgi:hypothetical protein
MQNVNFLSALTASEDDLQRATRAHVFFIITADKKKMEILMLLRDLSMTLFDGGQGHAASLGDFALPDA